MSGLLDLQRRMAKAVMQPLTRTNQMRRVVQKRSMTKEAAGFVLPNSRLTSFERLAIYNRQYWFRILDSLTEDFPGLRAVLGETQFSRVARSYLAECPSESFTLRNLGSRLTGWLEQDAARRTGLPANSSANAGQLDWQLALHMARLEWAHIEAFDAAEGEPLSPEQAGALTGNSTLALQPHVRLLEVRHAVDDILLAIKKSPRPIARLGAAARAKWFRQFSTPAGATGAKAGRAIYVAAHRMDFSVHYKRLEREAFYLLSALGSGLSLDASIERAFAETSAPEPDCAGKARDWFAQWMTLGWFCRRAALSNQVAKDLSAKRGPK